MALKLSIVVPVYNVARYLTKCLQSLIDQDMPAGDYEIVVVDDGSTDGSLSIVQHFAQKHDNVRIYSQENGGLSVARNTGIRQAEGEFLMFVDSDDYLQPESLGGLLRRVMEDNLDVLRFDYQAVDEAHRIIPKSKAATFAVDMSETTVDGATFLTHRLGWACYAPMYLFRAELFASGELFFKPGILFEDAEWLPRLLLKAQRVSSADRVVYNYLRRAGSITRATDQAHKNRLVEDRLSLIDSLQDLGSKYVEKEISQWIKSFIALSVMKILSYASQYPAGPRRQILASLKKRNVFPLNSRHFTLNQKMQVLLINLSPRLFMKYKGRGRSR